MDNILFYFNVSELGPGHGHISLDLQQGAVSALLLSYNSHSYINLLLLNNVAIFKTYLSLS